MSTDTTAATVSDDDVEPGIRTSLRRIFGVFFKRGNDVRVEARQEAQDREALAPAANAEAAATTSS